MRVRIPAFWLGQRVRSRSLTSGSVKVANTPSLKGFGDNAPQRTGGETATDQIPSTDDAPDERDGEGRMEGASAADNLAEVDFRKIADPAQIEQAHAIAAQLAKAMRTKLTRRDLARRCGYRLDLRRTIHRNISHGGVPISLVKRQRKQKPLRLVVLLDASGSMSMYTGISASSGRADEFQRPRRFCFTQGLRTCPSDGGKSRWALDRLCR